MNCPNWEPLVEHRLRGRAEPAGWREALAHATVCRTCRRRALALDPSLLFGLLARSPTEPVEEPDFLEALPARVRAARRAREIERSLGPAHRRRVPAAAAALLVAAGLLLATHGGRVTPSPPLAEGERAARPAIAGWALREMVRPAAEAAPPPLIEALDRPQARIYQLGQDDDLSLVMIVDESLDV